MVDVRLLFGQPKFAIVATFLMRDSQETALRSLRNAHIYNALSYLLARPFLRSHPLLQFQIDEAYELFHLHQMAMYQSLFHNVYNDNELTRQVLLQIHDCIQSIDFLLFIYAPLNTFITSKNFFDNASSTASHDFLIASSTTGSSSFENFDNT